MLDVVGVRTLLPKLVASFAIEVWNLPCSCATAILLRFVHFTWRISPEKSCCFDLFSISVCSEWDLLELYCGNGNFTVPLAANFRRVVATEVSKPSVAAAQHNMKVRGTQIRYSVAHTKGSARSTETTGAIKFDDDCFQSHLDGT